jgi:multiple antibiotic resistance protein
MDALRFGLRAFVAIFPIVNPFSAAILLLTLTPGDSKERRLEQARRAVVFMTAILVVSYFAGSAILNFFSITRPALVLAAAVLVCRSGWRALAVTDRISPEAREEGLHKEDVSLTPIGMPMLAGPGAISVAIGLSADASGITRNTAGIVAILLVSAISYLVLAAAPAVSRRLGRTGEAAISKVMGLITLAVGIQFLINGVSMVVGDLKA